MSLGPRSKSAQASDEAPATDGSQTLKPRLVGLWLALGVMVGWVSFYPGVRDAEATDQILIDYSERKSNDLSNGSEHLNGKPLISLEQAATEAKAKQEAERKAKEDEQRRKGKEVSDVRGKIGLHMPQNPNATHLLDKTPLIGLKEATEKFGPKTNPVQPLINDNTSNLSTPQTNGDLKQDLKPYNPLTSNTEPNDDQIKDNKLNRGANNKSDPVSQHDDYMKNLSESDKIKYNDELKIRTSEAEKNYSEQLKKNDAYLKQKNKNNPTIPKTTQTTKSKIFDKLKEITSNLTTSNTKLMNTEGQANSGKNNILSKRKNIPTPTGKVLSNEMNNGLKNYANNPKNIPTNPNNSANNDIDSVSKIGGKITSNDISTPKLNSTSNTQKLMELPSNARQTALTGITNKSSPTNNITTQNQNIPAATSNLTTSETSTRTNGTAVNNYENLSVKVLPLTPKTSKTQLIDADKNLTTATTEPQSSKNKTSSKDNALNKEHTNILFKDKETFSPTLKETDPLSKLTHQLNKLIPDAPSNDNLANGNKNYDPNLPPNSVFKEKQKNIAAFYSPEKNNNDSLTPGNSPPAPASVPAAAPPPTGPKPSKDQLDNIPKSSNGGPPPGKPQSTIPSTVQLENKLPPPIPNKPDRLKVLPPNVGLTQNSLNNVSSPTISNTTVTNGGPTVAAAAEVVPTTGKSNLTPSQNESSSASTPPKNYDTLSVKVQQLPPETTKTEFYNAAKNVANATTDLAKAAKLQSPPFQKTTNNLIETNPLPERPHGINDPNKFIPTGLSNADARNQNGMRSPPNSNNAPATTQIVPAATPGEKVPPPVSTTALTAQETAAANALKAQQAADAKLRGPTNVDPCPTSTHVNGKYSCQGTENLTNVAQMGTQMGMMGGQMAAQGMGAAAQTNAYSTTKQKEQMKAAAELAIDTAAVQTAIGGSTFIMGAAVAMRGGRHTSNATELGKINPTNVVYKNSNGVETLAGTKNDVLTSNVIVSYGLEGQSRAVAEGHLAQIKSTAVSEQARVASSAKVTGFMTTLQGLQQSAAAGVALGAGLMMRDAANKYTDPTILPPPNIIMPLNDMNTSSPNGGGGSTVINGNGTDPNSAPVTDGGGSATVAPPTLGTGFDPNPVPSTLGPGEGAGAFNVGTPEGGGGGGGGDAGGGGETSAAQAAPEQGAMVAQNPEGQAYATGGSFAGGGGNGGGKGAEGGPDLSGLLAAFLPKKDDAPKTNGIMEFGGQSPASTAGDGPASMFDRNVNIFERVHETYQDKHKRGSLGL